MLRHVPALTLALLLTPIAAGLAQTWLPAFGWSAPGGEGPSLAPWRDLLAAPELPAALRLTLASGVLATAVSLLLAIGFAAACHGTRLFRAIRHCLAPLLALPHAALAIGLAFLLAPSGWIVRLLSPWATGWSEPPDLASVQDPWGLALVAGLVIKETPYLLLMILAAIGQTGAESSLRAARGLGYGPAMAWLKVVLPRIYPLIQLPVFAVLAFSLSVVDMAIVLAPNAPPPLGPLVLRWLNASDPALRLQASAGACLQLGVAAGAILAWAAMERAVARACRPLLADGRRGRLENFARSTAGPAMIGIVAAAGLAIAGLALWSLAQRWRFPEALPTAWSLANWERHLDQIAWPASTTLSVAASSAALALVLGLACLENERRRAIHLSSRALWLLYLPLLVPQLSFLSGVQSLFVAIGIDGTWPALVWCHLLFVFPYVFLSLADPFRRLDERYVRTALCLGSTQARVFWRIRLPMLARPVLTAFAVGFAVSVALYVPTLFAGAGRFTTIATEAVGLAAGADRRVMGVYAFLQALLPFLAFGLALGVAAWRERRRRGLAAFA